MGAGSFSPLTTFMCANAVLSMGGQHGGYGGYDSEDENYGVSKKTKLILLGIGFIVSLLITYGAYAGYEYLDNANTVTVSGKVIGKDITSYRVGKARHNRYNNRFSVSVIPDDCVTYKPYSVTVTPETYHMLNKGDHTAFNVKKSAIERNYTGYSPFWWEILPAVIILGIIAVVITLISFFVYLIE